MPDDQLPEPTELDEVASAILDDEATAAERARIDVEPALVARVDEFRAISDQVGSVAALTDDRRDALITAAISAAPTIDGEETAEVPTPPAAVSLAQHRSRRTTRKRSELATFAAIAAVIIAILAVPALLIGLNRTSNVHDTALSSGDAEASYESQGSGVPADAASTTTGDPAGYSSNSRTYAGQPVALGDVASTSDLEASVQVELAKQDPDPQNANDDAAATTTTASAPRSSTTASAPPVAPQPFTGACEDAIRQELPSAGTLILGGTVDYQGSPRHVYAFRTDPDGPVTIIVADPETCEIVARTVLPQN